MDRADRDEPIRRERALRRRQRALTALYLGLVALTLLNLAGAIFNTRAPVLGIPGSVVWLLVWLLLLLGFTIGGYFWVLRPWARRVDASDGGAGDEAAR